MRAALSSVFLLVALAGPARAQAGPHPHAPPPDTLGRLSLDAIVEEAWARNLGLAQERLREGRAEAELRGARGAYLPALTVDARYSEQSGTLDLGEFVNPVYGTINDLIGEDRFPTDLSFALPLRHESRVRLAQPLFDLRIGAGREAATAGLEGQRARTDLRIREVAAEAQAAALRVAAARSARRIWEATLPVVDEGERVAQRLVDAGTATPDAVFRARADREEVVQELAVAREREAAATRAFNLLLQRPLDRPAPEIDESELLVPLPLDADEAVVRALEARPEVRSVEAGIRRSDAGVRAATASFFPSVGVAVDYGFQGADISFGGDDDFWIASLVVSWNVFNGGRDAARKQAAEADRDRLRLQLRETLDQVRLDVRQAWGAARVARSAIGTAEERLAAAERNFELVRRRWEEGLVPQIEFLDARTALTRAELNRIVTLYQYAIRWVELERAAALRELPDAREIS